MMKDLYDLLDEFAQHAPPRPEAYKPFDIEDQDDPAAQRRATREWRARNEAAWRWHYAIEMVKQRALAREALSIVVKEAREAARG